MPQNPRQVVKTWLIPVRVLIILFIPCAALIMGFLSDKINVIGSIPLAKGDTWKLHSKQSTDDIVKVTFLQLNDVYEISPIDNGKSAGMARVASYCNNLRKENPNTYVVVAGDFLSPSAIGTAKVES